MDNTNHTFKHIAALVTAFTFGFAGISTALAAEDYPRKSIQVGVMYDAGGASDFQARVATSEAQKYYGQPVVIVNKVGAGGMTGWNEFVSNAKPDGYELASYNVPHIVAQSLQYPERVRYNIDNMIPIANWGADPAVLVVPADSEFDTLDELVEFAKENPGRITANGAGLYVGHHIALLQLMDAADIDITYVPDTGAVPAMKKVLADQIAMGFNNLSDSYRNKERIKILAIAADERDEHFLPDVPTFQELGYDVDATSMNLRGLMAPEGTPEEILDFLEEKSIAMFNDEDVQKRMLEGGSPVLILDREETYERWKQTHDVLSELFADQ